jgi:hypothetical protein
MIRGCLLLSSLFPMGFSTSITCGSPIKIVLSEIIKESILPE